MMGRASAEDLARMIAKRPGMHLGAASYERAIGFLHGVASLASAQRAASSTDEPADHEFGADDFELLARVFGARRPPGVDEGEAIRQLEPLLAEALAALQASCAATPSGDRSTGEPI